MAVNGLSELSSIMRYYRVLSSIMRHYGKAKEKPVTVRVPGEGRIKWPIGRGGYSPFHYRKFSTTTFTSLGLKRPRRLLANSGSSSRIHRRMVSGVTPQRSANWASVMDLYSLIFDNLEGVRLGQGFVVHSGDGGLQGGKVQHTVLAACHVVGGGEDAEMCGVGEKQGRYGSEAMANGYQVAVVLSAAQEHGANSRVGRVGGDVASAVVAHQQPVLEQSAHLTKLFELADDDPTASYIGGDTLRVVGMHNGQIQPLVFVRRHHQHAAMGFEGPAHEFSDLRRLSRSRLADNHHLEDLARLSLWLGHLGQAGG